MGERVALVVLARRHRLNAWDVLDAGVFFAAVGQPIGRLAPPRRPADPDEPVRTALAGAVGSVPSSSGMSRPTARDRCATENDLPSCRSGPLARLLFVIRELRAIVRELGERR